MCGIAGYFRHQPLDNDVRANLERMGRAIAHRGPDGRGFWSDETAGVAFVHNRLAIIDLTPSGLQPMHSQDGRWVLLFNGEIYNFERIRAELDQLPAPPSWRGTSDTEVLLEAISNWGLEGALQRAIGMFAIALWDRMDRRLTFARDRAGEKPLYYGWCGDTLLFGSELKALRAHPMFDGAIDSTALNAYMRYGYVPAPHSIYSGISKLLPGHTLSFSNSDEPRSTGLLSAYWRRPAHAFPSRGGLTAISQDLETLLSDAIGLQMRADVPMGAFLSGGIDSSLIVALMQEQSSKPVNSFAIGFEEASFNEAVYAAEVARHLGTSHHELTVTAAEAVDVIPSLPFIYDEPFADSSQIPTYLLSKLTRQHVTVSLSGDAGDELFGGYTRYLQTQQFEGWWRRTPRWGRRGMARALRAAPPALWDGAASIAPRKIAGFLTRDRVPKVASVLESDDVYAIYRRLVSQWSNPGDVVRIGSEPAGWIDDAELREMSPDIVSWMMAVDFRTYLPDDILAKVDRASMAVSLESRVPFLDHRVIEFATTIPVGVNIEGGVGKRVLREILYRHVPKKLIDRPKQGFGIPLAAWLRGPLRDWAEDLLESSALEQSGLDSAAVRSVWQRHISGREDLHYPLWVVLMLQAWHRAEAEPARVAA